ncbi:MAG: GspH/FimT family pseudopilin [Burkholderiaceae bacterium]|nr:GspH/FimT family pseudopilin [Rhodoferax sp.]MCP5283353.1 GspH/FimT family pseudopilin [Burkholderiaceae bacterium]
MLGSLSRWHRNGRGCMKSGARRGFTLVELVIAMSITAILVVVAAPNLYDFILVQRLKSVNAQLVTDLQYARAEAAARNQLVLMRFSTNDTLSCYVLYVHDTPASRVNCDCRTAATSTCPAGASALRTVRLPKSDKVLLRVPGGQATAVGFDHISGGIRTVTSDFFNQPLGIYRVEAYLDNNRVLRNDLGGSGRVTICSPSSGVSGAPAC